MNICDSYTIRSISLDECVGTSLLTINNNFSYLRDQACTDSEQLSTINTEVIALTSNYIALSAQIPGVVRAWVVFSGSNAAPTGEVPMYKTYNVQDVRRLSQGNYRINFNPTFSNSNYAVIGTCQQTTTPTWVQATTFNTMSAGINICNTNTGTFQDSEYVSVLVYNN